MSITLDVSAGLLNEPDEVLLGLVDAGHVGSWTGAGGGGGGVGGIIGSCYWSILKPVISSIFI